MPSLQRLSVMAFFIGAQFCLSAFAQVTTATLYGVVRDPSDAAIAGAAVSVTNENTGIRISRTTDISGEFAFDFLPVGSYTLLIEKSGFKGYKLSRMALRAGQEVRQTHVLQIGAVSEQVTVEALAPLVNTASSEQGEDISNLKVRDLPLAQRNLVALGGLTTGVIAELGSGNNSGTFNYNGLGHSATSVTVDGTDASASSTSPQMMMFGGFNYISVVSLEAVEEVQTTKGVSPAEYAPSMSGNINVVTKSGTNQWHGSLFENFQGRALNARYQFLATKRAFTFNQFGGSAGGRILKDKLFVFSAYEGYRRAAFAVVQGNVPTQALRDQMLAAFPDYKLVLNALPLPNQPTPVGSVVGLYLGASAQRASDNHLVVKPDYWITDHHKISVTYTRGRPQQSTPRVSPDNPRIFFGEAGRITGTYTTFGARWSAESRFGYNRNYVNRLDQWFDTKDPNKTEQQPGDRRVPDINALGFSIGGGEANILGGPGNWSLEQKVAIQSGKHSLKFGGIFFDRRTGGSDIESPSITYVTLTDLLANNPARVQVTFGTASYMASSKDFGFFLQDNWRMTPRLVVNLGLRWDYFGKMTANGTDGGGPHLYNPDGLLDSNFHIGPFRPTGDPFHSDAFNLGPRVGFAYNPDGRGTNVLRFGASALFSPVVTEDFLGGIINGPSAPFRSTFSQEQSQALGLRFPVYNVDVLPLLQRGVGSPSIILINPNLQAPYSLNLYFGYQRTLNQSLTLESAFVGNHGVKFVMRRIYNDPNRVTGLPPNLAIGSGQYFDNSDSTHYLSWQTSLRKRYANNLTFDVHYTWSKTMSYGVGDIGSNPSPIQDFFNVKANRGPAGDITHLVTSDFVYQLPRLAGIGNPFVRHALGGWEVSGILSAHTGQPINIAQPCSLSSSCRPDATGVSPILPNYRSTLLYLNPAAISLVPLSPISRATIRPGNLGNGAIRAPGLWNLDFAVAKNFAITERVHLQLRGDMFNAPNHTNLAGVSGDASQVTFGRLTGTTGARVAQLNGRLTF
jgi:hypothetical protein